MKKVFFSQRVILPSALIALAFSLSNCNNQSNKAAQTKLWPADGITLTGDSAVDASAMVGNFKHDTSSSHQKTAIWLSKMWVDSALRAVKGQNGDGIRIYFAKQKSDRSNAIVIVYTKQGAKDPKAESGYDHTDFFDHKSSFFKVPLLPGNMEIDLIGNKGATLFTTSPNSNVPCSITTIDPYPNEISPNKAFEAVKNFNSLPKKEINTHSEWFSIGLLEAIQTELNAAPSNVKADGIRIYFAKNPANAQNVKHQNRNCFVIVTTRLDTTDNKTHLDDYNCYIAGHKLGGTEENGEECPNNCVGVSLP